MGRNTKQREAIRAAFQRRGRPLSVPETHAAAQESVGGIGIATVYRNIRTLCDDGWLSAVELPGEPPRYEPAGLPHHHHFRCHGCDKLFDVPECEPIQTHVIPHGFRVDSHTLVLYGHCPECCRSSPAS